MKPEENELDQSHPKPAEAAGAGDIGEEALGNEFDMATIEPDPAPESNSSLDPPEASEEELDAFDTDSGLDVELSGQTSSSGASAATPSPTLITRFEATSEPGNPTADVTQIGKFDRRAQLLPLPGGPATSGANSNANSNQSAVGQALPRLQVLVSLAESRAMYVDPIQEVLDAHALEFQQIARSEVEYGFRCYQIERMVTEW